MTRERRNKLTPARRSILTRPGTLYTVCCLGKHCDCPQFGADCRRGFFSLWIQAIYGRFFAWKLGIPCYIDFGDRPYLYSHPSRFQGDVNFWNYYYRQEHVPGKNYRIIRNNFIENYPLRIWNSSFLNKIHDAAVKDLSLQIEAKTYIDTLIYRCQQQSTMGLHIRKTDHPIEVQPIPYETYKGLIRRNLKKYQAFFIATDDEKVLNMLIREFGDERIIFQQAQRSQTGEALHTSPDHHDHYGLGLEVLADCYALSACQHAVLVHSNVSYGALLLNPRLSYTLLETAKSRRSRRRTALLYTLDRWGIRKM